MFVVTFYSYKGGVGRTMALVNVAANLARRGKKVLVVDFDLEAPSLPNYGFLGSCASRKGLVDYIAAYRIDGVSPNATDYIYECNSEDTSIWVMPSGDTSTFRYSSKLASIDWSTLYSEEKGYLFFEDLKQQWKENDDLGFDYVLIDSRTGHTDVGGICTRQLPDLVVAMFLPTMQNISGLAPIIKEIRSDKARHLRPVEILFCASNVPDLDDERSILSGLLGRAAEDLSFDTREMKIVHQYASLDVLSHAIFSIHRPNSKLAKEYSELEQAVISYNHFDPDGALLALKAIRVKVRRSAQRPRFLEREKVVSAVDRIFSLHVSNSDIAIIVAQIRSMIGDIEGEINALTTAIDSGGESISLRGMRARAYQAIGLKDRSDADLTYIVESAESSSVDITTALQMLRGSSERFDDKISSLLSRGNLSVSVLNSLSEFVLSERRHLSRYADQLNFAVREIAGSPGETNLARVNLALSLIGSERFKDAIDLLKGSNEDWPEGILDMFNLFIADWAYSGNTDTSLADAILKKILVADDREDPNYLQCTAVLKAIMGERDQSCLLLDRAIKLAHLQKRGIFSCASYLYRTPKEFGDDCERLRDEIIEKRVVRLELGHSKPMVSI
jgi:MinD-like ATPase involved in chromosome partitioning or flagellar assembly